MKKNLHILPRGKKWAIIGVGNEQAISIFDDKKDAVAMAEKIAKTQKSDIKIHGRDGEMIKSIDFMIQ